ncbi:MAG: hypothetical protein AAF222_11095 [Pseudomonadota bacterium]
MSTRAKWIITLALLIIAGLWLATLLQLKPVFGDTGSIPTVEMSHAA